MKFGRAPTTKQTGPGTGSSLPETPGVSVDWRVVLAVKVVFWASLGALVWTHAAYPVAAAAAARVRAPRGGRAPGLPPRAGVVAAPHPEAARVRPRRVRRAEELPRVAVIVAAHDEEAVIERRVENLLALDYPRDRYEVMVASDASTDRTEEADATMTSYRSRG